MIIQGCQHHRAQSLVLDQVAELADRCLIRGRLTSKINADATSGLTGYTIAEADNLIDQAAPEEREIPATTPCPIRGPGRRSASREISGALDHIALCAATRATRTLVIGPSKRAQDRKRCVHSAGTLWADTCGNGAQFSVILIKRGE